MDGGDLLDVLPQGGEYMRRLAWRALRSVPNRRQRIRQRLVYGPPRIGAFPPSGKGPTVEGDPA